MKVTGVRTRIIRLPIRSPVISRSGVFDTMWNVLVDVETSEGISGSTYLWAYTEAGARALSYIIADLSEAAIGESPFFSTRVWERNRLKLSQWGRRGFGIFGLSGIDIALWDIAGKATGRPLAHLLGAVTDQVPVYASGGLWMIDDHHQLAEEAAGFARRGFRGMKMRLGRSRMLNDLAAVQAVRDAIGPETDLMVDVNQGWSPEYAVRIGRRLEEFDLYWLEEPTAHDDLRGHAQIAAALDTPIASGEKLSMPDAFRQALEMDAFDIAMPDVERIGGVTGWLRTAALAAAWHRPICSHLFPEVSIHLVAASPTACYLEHMPWTAELFQEDLEIVDGRAIVPERPGLGFTWNEAAVSEYLVESA